MMKEMFSLLSAIFFFAGCSAAGYGPMSQKWHELPDGSMINAFQAKNSGISGTDVTAIESWRCPKGGECGVVGQYSGATPGAVEVGVAGMGAAALQATGAGVAAHLLRPTRVNQNITGGGDTSVDVGVKQNQGQGQEMNSPWKK